MYETKYTVKGTFEFPLDMLRYDCSFPDSQAAVVAMGKNTDGERCVDLAMYRRDRFAEPRRERWESFGWTIVRQDPPRKVS